MRLVVSDASIVSSLSHRRPRAMAATSVVSVSERIGRACCGGVPSAKNLTASGRWGSLPGDTKDVMGVGFLAIGCRLWVAGYLDDQLFRSNLNACNPGSNEATVANRLGRFEVLPNRFDN